MNQSEKVIVMRSLTHAIKAKKLLQEYGIDARVVKPDAGRAEKGCGYGVAVKADKRGHAEGILRENGLPPLEIG